MKLRAEIKLQARRNFSSQYGISIGAFILIALISFVLSLPSILSSNWGYHSGHYYSSHMFINYGFSGPFWIASLLLMPPISVGYASSALRSTGAWREISVRCSE